MKKINSPIMVTGSSGFIGAAMVLKLLQNGEKVIGIDNLNNYYDINLKIERNKLIDLYSSTSKGKWNFYNVSIEDKNALKEIFEVEKPKIVINLAAQAGVRYSIENPSAYIQSNIVGFNNILEECKNNEIKNLIYASSSSVYGGNKKLPFKETDAVNHPISLYAASKRSNELMAHVYSHLFNLPTTGLRFFTVYGPWGRPDMAPMIFTKAIIEKKKIKVNNYGNMIRDFTYIDDVTESIFRCCFKPATSDKNFDYLNQDPSMANAPYRIFNIGNSSPIKLLDFIEKLEKELNISAIKEFVEMQPGDVISTESDSKLLQNWIKFTPSTKIELGIKKLVDWYKMFYKI